ncbi:MAG: glycosyltransferase family 39 protein [Planctomycetes bacterium]|nr:glycosyltransferase family 39 protein [Planctomycetota bacterium]
MKSHRKLLFAILLVALLLRLAGGYVVRRQVVKNFGAEAQFLFPDSDNFWAYGKNLSERGEYIDDENRHAWRTPVYSILLAGMHRLGVQDAVYLRLLNNFISVLNVFLAFLVASKVFGKRAGLIAAAIMAVYPFFIYFSNLVIADTLGVSAVIILTLAAMRCMPPATPCIAYDMAGDDADKDENARKPGEIGSFLLFGLALAFAILVKASFALIGLFYIFFFVLRLVGLRKILRPDGDGVVNGRADLFCAKHYLVNLLLFTAIGLCLGMSPWWYRNYRTFDTFVPFSSMGGFTLYESNSEKADGGPNNGKIIFPAEWYLLKAVCSHREWYSASDKEEVAWFHDNQDGMGILCVEPLYAFYKMPVDVSLSLDGKYLEHPVVGYESDWLPKQLARPRASLLLGEDYVCGGAAGYGKYFNDHNVYEISYSELGTKTFICVWFPFNNYAMYTTPDVNFPDKLYRDDSLIEPLRPRAELGADRLLKQDSFRWIRESPERFLSLVSRRIARMWNIWPNWEGASGWHYKLVSAGAYVPVMLLALYCMLRRRREWRTLGLFIIPAVYLLCLHSIFMGSLRYRLPAMGCFIILAAGGLDLLLRRLKSFQNKDNAK